MRYMLRFMLFALLCSAALAGHAQTWPNKPVKFILSQAAGTPPDIIARMLGDRLAREIGQQIVVDNRGGGANIPGSQAAARSPADGYTFFFATTAAIVTNLYTFKSLPYDPVRDFTPVSMIGLSPFLVAAHPELKASGIRELIALEKSQPDKLSFASDGQRGFGGMMGDMLKTVTGTKVVHVPYSGAAQAIQDTVAGRTQYTLMGIPAVIQFVKRGQLKALAVSSPKRLPGLEEIPTIAETVPGFAYVGWFVLLAPAGVPADIVKTANHAMGKVLADPEIVRRLRDFGIYTEGAGTPESTAAFIAAERGKWAKVVKDVGIEPE